MPSVPVNIPQISFLFEGDTENPVLGVPVDIDNNPLPVGPIKLPLDVDQYTLRVRVSNPNEIVRRIVSLQFQATEPFSGGDAQFPVDIPANGAATIPVALSITGATHGQGATLTISGNADEVVN